MVILSTFDSRPVVTLFDLFDRGFYFGEVQVIAEVEGRANCLRINRTFGSKSYLQGMHRNDFAHHQLVVAVLPGLDQFALESQRFFQGRQLRRHFQEFA
jgi:hypothetical protein